MFDGKTEKQISNSPEAAPESSLEGAKTSGDKPALLEALITEGKLASSPFQGPTALLNETTVSAQEIIQHSVTGSSTADIEAAKNLPLDMKVSLMERVLEQYPNTTMKEIRATCATLEIDSGPFIKESTEKTAKEIQGQIKDAKTTRDLDNVVLNLFYRDSEAIALVDSNIEKSLGKPITDLFAGKTNDPSQKVALELALLGQTLDPYLDLQRVQALLQYERRQQDRTGVPLSTAQEIHIERMEKYLLEAANEIAQTKDKIHYPKGDEDTPIPFNSSFYNCLKEAQNSWSDYIESKTWWQKNPAALRSVLITVLLIGSLFIIQDKQNPILYWVATFAFGVLVFKVGDSRFQKSHQNIKNKIVNEYITASEKRGFKRSARLKAHLNLNR